MLGGVGEAFADRNFRFYSIGAIVSWLSFFAQLVAVSWSTWELTHSTSWLAAIAVLDIVPNLLLLPLGGVLADRSDRFRMLVITYGLALCQALALAVLSWFGRLSIEALAVLAVLHGAIHSFSMPALYGLLPRFVARERLSSAIAVAAAYTQLAIFTGPALAGWIIARYGASAAFGFNVLGYVVWFGSVAALRTPADYRPPVASGASIGADLIDSARYIVGHRGISGLLLLGLAGDAVSAAVYQMLPALAAAALRMGVDGMTGLMSAAGFGATLAALWLAHGGAARASPSRVLWAVLASGVAVVALALAGGLVAGLAAMVLFGSAGEIRATSTVSILQTSVDDRQRGRVMSTQFLLKRAAGGIGTLVIGIAAERFGIRWPLLAAGFLVIAAWAVAIRWRHRITGAFASGETRAEPAQAV